VADRRIRIERVEAYALSAAVAGGPVSSLAEMPTRNGLLLRLFDRDGAWGWGEAWCNFPPRGNLAKLMLLEDVVAPALMREPLESWSAARPALEARFARMRIHVGEDGPFSHLLAGVDMALADLAARREGLALSRLIADAPADTVPVYASSPAPDRLETLLPALVAAGHDAVKMKIGYDWQTDIATLERFRKALPDAVLYVDANQAWEPAAAAERIPTLAAWRPQFVEEPLRADHSVKTWSRLAAAVPIPLAAGENILSAERFAAMVEARALGVIQPDVAKWGGVSGPVAAARHARAQGARCFLHYMGTALGLAVSAHVLAAVGGDGRIELDANDNPLRTDLGAIDLTVRGGRMAVPPGPGIGFVPDPARLAALTVGAISVRAG
jgi:L-alanine-DL-glutamate epimerase-like enolase superfamily enzyme